MTAIIQTEKLTKSYGEHRGIVDVDLEVERRARSSASSARTAPARRRRSGRCSTTSGRRAAGRSIFGIDTTVDPVAIHRRLGYLPGEFALYDKLTGGQTIEYFANLRGGVDPAYQAELIERLDIDPTPQVQGVLEGQQAEDRAGHRAPAPAGPADPRRADVRPRPARPADVLRGHPRGEGRGPDGLPVEPHPVARSRRPATAWRSSATAGWSRVDRVEALRDLAHHQVELRFAGARAGRRRSRRCPACRDVVAEDHTLRMRVSGPITPVVQAAARYELLDFVSREPSLEETFLAEYGRRARRPRWHDPMTATARPRPAAPLAVPLAAQPDLRLRQRLRQDHPRFAPRDDHRRAVSSASCC